MQHTASTMTLNQARERLGRALALSAAGELAEAVELCTSIIERLPRDGSASTGLLYAYQELILLRQKQGLAARALRAFHQYIADCAPRCDARFDAAYEEGLRRTQTSPIPLGRRERFHSLLVLAEPALNRAGFVAECGVFRGLSSSLLLNRLRELDAAFDGTGYRVFDSFAGLSAPQPEDAADTTTADAERVGEMARAGEFAATLAEVQQALAAYPGVEYFPGWIPAAFPDDTTARYRFVHLDVDLHQPARDGLEYFWPRLVPGARIVCDDYTWPGARRAIEEFCRRTGTAYHTTPFGQAWLERPGDPP